MKEFVGYNAKQFKVPGVYLISAGPYSYVGSATIVSRRLHNHASKLRHNKHYSQNIQGCFNTGDKIQVSILEEMVGATDGQILDREIFWTQKLQPTENKKQGQTLLSPEFHHASVYNEDQIVRCMNLINAGNKYKRVSELTGISIGVISHVARGVSHTWLKNKHPEQYQIMVNSVGERFLKTKFDIKHILESILAGESQTNIAKRLGSDTSTITHIKRRHGNKYKDVYQQNKELKALWDSINS